MKAVVALAKYEGATSAEDKEASLEQLRDLCIEIEGEGDTAENGVVRVVSGTAFFSAGEVEEALESLGAGTEHENLEACVQIMCVPYPTLNSPLILVVYTVSLLQCMCISLSIDPTSPRKNLTDQNSGPRMICSWG